MTSLEEPARLSRRDAFTPIALLVGGLLIPFAGWLVGVVLLWVSSAWTRREKIIGTLVIPGGLALPMFLLAVTVWSPSSDGCEPPRTTPDGTVFEVCSSRSVWLSDPGLLILIVVTFVVPVLTAVYLIRQARDAPRPAPTA